MPEARARGEAWRTLTLVLSCGVAVVTCSATRSRDLSELPPTVFPPPQASASALASAGEPLALAPAASSPVTTAAPSSSAALPVAPRTAHGPLPLPRFYAAADELRAGKRTEHVRVVWLGDSHTMADLWTGVVRRALVAKLGSGGPGFVHAGFDPKKYRHDGVKLDTLAKWNVAPVPYSKMKREDDGVFGLGGVRFAPAEGEAHAIVEVSEGDKRPSGDALTWDVAYRVEPGATLRATLGAETTTLRGDEESGPGGIKHHRFRSAGNTGKLDLAATAGLPQLLGVTIEGTTPGLVLDTVGLNGARVGTFLAWDRDAWIGELSRRKPSLTVLAFGTNESADRDVPPERYAAAMTSLLERVQAAAPDGDCLVITPMDRPGPDFATRIADISRGFEQAAKKAGCAVWNASAVMGGHGSMEAWSHESPPRSGQDGIHLTPKGYQWLGDKLARDLIEGLGASAVPL